MMDVDMRQCAPTYDAPVVAANYQVGNNHVSNLHFDEVNNDAEYH